ncbi:MAG: porphobilinogen synthase [Magnetococcales bacterium]|nr:porphobilinogen synthase [Magnetococcales bacterium]MBF0154622.1 porphobilinogen synthase [Magnetococcales bacterium]
MIDFSMPRRPRRLRRSGAIREMVRENQLRAENLMLPLFIVPGSKIRREVSSMPGVHQLSIDQAVEDAAELLELGVRSVILFGIPESKDAEGSDAFSDEGIIQRALRAFRRELPELYLVADACFCEYTDHGHCGVLHQGEVDNDATLANLARSALSYAEAGVDMVAPSGMMDGMVQAIRSGLDRAGHSQVAILSYAAKYASAYYGPFRDAAESTPRFGDRRAYQMDPANRREALREVALDIEQGADLVMVKPGLPYLDIVRDVRERFDCPVAVYNVSGEYAMVKAAAANGWIDEKRVVLETLTSFRRAGADLILTYHARDAARWLKQQD